MDKDFLKLIEQYDNISIFRHEFADPDALGAQFGLKSLIEDNFENKSVKALGLPVKSLNNSLYPAMDEADDSFIASSLAIILDTANIGRIDDKRYRLSKKIVKIDHHPSNEDYGDLNIVDVSVSATSYLLARIAYKNKLKVSKTTATYLYSGLVGDTGRFLHNNTTVDVFGCAKYLLANKADIAFVYDKMYKRSIKDLKLVGFIQQNFKIYQGRIAYYTLQEKDYAQFNVDFEKAKEHVNVLANIEDIAIWVSATFNPETKYYHISIRSSNIVINDVAEKFGGGGHKFASGVRVSTLARLNLILDELSKKLL